MGKALRFIELITEGRDAALYHGAGFGGALGILQEDRIRAATSHDAAKLFQARHVQDPVTGVSLSRSLATAFDFGPVVFELDQRRLAQASKLVPFDYWSASNPKQPSKRGQSPTSADRYEFEEFCIGPVAPLSRTLRALHLTERSYRRCLVTESLAMIASHPLLQVNRRTVNRFPAPGLP